MASDNRNRLNVLLFYGFMLVLAYLACRILAPFIMTLAWAAILALAASPLYSRLRRRRWSSPKAALASTLVTLLLLVVPALMILVALGREVGQGVTSVQTALEDPRFHGKLAEALTWVRSRVPLPDMAELKPRLTEGAEAFTRFLAGSIGSILQDAAKLVFHLVISLVAMFFLLRDSKELSAFFRRLLPFDEIRKAQLIDQSRQLVIAGTLVTLAIAAAQGLAGGILFASLGLNSPVLWGAVMGVFALIPLVGTAIVWLPAALWLMATGDWVRGLVLVGVGTLLVGGIDNVLRPALMSGKSSLNGLIAMLSMMGGLVAFGFIGLVLGPVIAAAVVTLLTFAASES
jgi:predicted PurR-regulated permease PerM